MSTPQINSNFQSKTVYQIYVRSFYDADGDGYGDIKGVIKKLPYLHSLGVEYLWLNPVFPSPQCDNGYDISDYCAIDPIFGTMADLEKLINEAEQLGIGIIFDMVFNHTSIDHPWFKKALAGDKKYMDYYFFKPGRENNLPPTNWISKFGGSTWEKVESLNQYYLHLFSVGQADLNWQNAQLREELHEILRFWIKKGIRGFRFDVINLISKPDQFEDDFVGDGRRFYTDGANVNQYLQEMYQVINEGRDSSDALLLVGELSSTSPEKCVPYCQPENKELSMVFHFQHLKTDYPDANQKWVLADLDFKALRDILHSWQLYMYENNAWDALFWNNHDQPRSLTRFASAKKEYHYQSATLLAATLHFMRGTPYVYMGEEIGMTNPDFDDIKDYRDVETLNYYQILINQGLSQEQVMEVIKKRSRDNSRTPMQWSGGHHAGFTKGEPWINAAKNKTYINVESEENKGSGILSFYKKLIRLRKEYEIIQSGSYRPIFTEIENVIAFERENELQYLLCINNYSEDQVQIPAYELENYRSKNARVLASNYSYNEISFRRPMVLQPYETVTISIDK